MLQESSIYALHRKCITKATELGGNYRQILRNAQLPAEHMHVPQSVIDKLVPYLMLALAFQLNHKASEMIPAADASKLDPCVHVHAHELLTLYEKERTRQRDANFEAICNTTPPDQTIPVPLTQSGRGSGAAAA